MMERSELSFNLEDSCPPLLMLCIKPMKAFELVRTHLKLVPLPLISLANECFALHRALVKVRRFDLHSLGVLEQGRGQQVLDSLEAFFLGCDMTMSAVNELAEEVRQHALVVSVSDVAKSSILPNLELQQFWKRRRDERICSADKGISKWFDGFTQRGSVVRIHRGGRWPLKLTCYF